MFKKFPYPRYTPSGLMNAFESLFDYDDRLDALAELDAPGYGEKFEERWSKMASVERGKWLCGRLWNSGSVMPSSTCHGLNLREGSSYSRGARRVLHELRWFDLTPIT